MNISVVDNSAKTVKELHMPEMTFGNVNEMITQTISYIRNSQRIAVAHTKDRGDVRGGGAKPWRQKGTGRARVGSSRSPLWRGGGVTFGPLSINNFATRLPHKVRHSAVRAALYQKMADGEVVAVEELQAKQPKTKSGLEMVNHFEGDSKTVLFILAEPHHDTELALRNIPGIRVNSALAVNLVDVLWAEKIIIAEPALKALFPDLSEKAEAKEDKPKTARRKKVTE